MKERLFAIVAAAVLLAAVTLPALVLRPQWDTVG